MNLLPHIDIAEPERIAAILADPANYAWRAIDCETPGDWTPDLGITAYTNPSLIRVPGVAWSGQPSTLRHRFWGTVEGQCDHTGMRYVGVLLYDAAGQECPLELRLGADDLGRVEPTRHDNRVHLIVLDQPVRFRGEMEVFQLTAPGKGEYRIEQFVLLRERPAPSRFEPRIDRLSARREADGAVTVHFITSQVASCGIVAQADGEIAPRRFAPDGMRTVHAVRLEGLRADRAWRLDVTATEKAGATATAEFTLAPASPTPAGRATEIPLELCGLGQAWPAGLPLTFGVPLEQGRVYPGQRCELHSGSRVTPAQTRILSHWPDGSARWLLADTSAPAAAGAALLHVSAEPAVDSVPVARSVAAGALAETGSLRVLLDGGLRVERHDGTAWKRLADGLELAGELADGRPLKGGAPQDVAIEENGPQRAVLRADIPVADEQGVVHLRCRLRLHVYANQPFIRVVQRLEVVSPELPTDGDEAKRMLRLRRLELRLNCATQAPTRRWVHEHDQAWRATTGSGTEVVSGRRTGHFRVPLAEGTLAVGIKEFWQTWPRGFRQSTGALALELFPELSGEPLPGDEEAWHRLYFWLKDGAYLLRSGLALRSEWLLGFLPADAGEPAADALFDWLEHPPVVRPDPTYTNATGVLVPFGIKATSTMPGYEALMGKAIAAFHADREHFRAYGQINFGDWYGESGWSWGNNEYDPPYCGYLEFLRGGDPGWTELGAQATRHLVDVDTVHPHGGQVVHMPGHLGGYLPPLFRSKIGGTFSIPSHTWVEGPVLHYLLTGDEFTRESIRETRSWLLQDHWFDNCEFSNCRESGWHIIHLCMLAAAFDDPRCLNGAAVIVRRVREKEAPAGGWVHMLPEAHCGCGYPRCRGEAGFMVGVLLSALKRYHASTGDAEAARMLVGGARWLIRNTYDAKSGYFRYTTCEKRTKGGTFQHTQWVLEGLADAFALSRDEEIGRYVHDGLKTIGQFPDWLDHLGLGKAMAMQMRYVPGIQAALSMNSHKQEERR
jgi:hypothetical protein